MVVGRDQTWRDLLLTARLGPFSDQQLKYTDQVSCRRSNDSAGREGFSARIANGAKPLRCRGFQRLDLQVESSLMASKLQRILLVEDEVDIQTVATLALRDVGGFDVEVCNSGEEAVRRGPGFSPQLILLDFMMPGMNGHATMLALRQMPAMKPTPIVFLTARAQLDEVEEYRRHGALDVIVKPFDPMTLATTVQDIWCRYQTSIAMGQVPTTGG